MTTTSEVLQRLRAATGTLHAALEDAVAWPARGLSVDAYGAHLLRLWGFHAPLEDALGGAPEPPGLDVTSLARAHLLERDLAALGWSRADLAAAPRCRALPAVASAGRVLGIAYVVEGAALGGAVLSRRVAAALPDAAARATAYLRPHGDGDAMRQRWRDFASVLDAAAPGVGTAELVAGAVDAFSALERWFRGSGVSQVLGEPL